MALNIIVLAPLGDEMIYHMDFALRLKKSNRELSLENLYQYFLRDLDEEAIPWDIKEGADIPSAGYYLTSLLKKNGYNVLLMSKYDDASLEKMAAFNPDVLCLSTTMIITLDIIRRMVDRIKNAMPEIFVIAGGVLIWKNYLSSHTGLSRNTEGLYDYGLFARKDSDLKIDVYVASSHGAKPLLMLLKEIEKGSKAKPESVPNLILRHLRKGYLKTNRLDEENDFDDDYTQWEYIDEMPLRVPVRTSIGCPYRCSFCDFCTMYPDIYVRSAESLRKEISIIKDRLRGKPYVIHISDDNIFLNPKRVHEVCDVFIEQKVPHWTSFMRASSITEENIGLIKESGLLMAFLGVESGDVEQLKNMRKNMNIARQKKGIELLDASGISSIMSLVVGFPGETDRSIKNTTNFLNELELKNAVTNYYLFPLLPFPLSELGNPEFQKKWDLKVDGNEWSHSTMHSDEVFPYGYELFKEVKYLPYYYYDESHFFNRSVFSLEERLSLFSLRRELSINIAEDKPAQASVDILKKIARLMKFETSAINEDIVKNILLKDKDRIK